MTRLVRFSNNAVSQLAANLTISGTSLSVTPGDGAKFPSLSAGQYFMATLVKADGSTEVVKVTARSTDTLTIVRAAEPVGGASTSYSFSAGDRIEARLTAGVLSDEIDRLDNGAVMEAINKSANYTLVADDVTKLVRVSTASGTTTITLPATSALTDDYDVIVAKVTGDANTVVIARTGSTDLINGATSYTIYNQWQSAWLIADRSTNTWTVISSGMSAVNTVVDAGTGSGSATITLSGDPGSKNNTALFIGGVYQQKATYSISGTTLTAGGTIGSGVGYEVVWSAPLTIGAPSDGTVTTAKIADANVTTVKIADLNITTAKLAANAVTYAKMQNVTAGKVLGRDTSGSGIVQELPIAVDASGNVMIGLANQGSDTNKLHIVSANSNTTGTAQFRIDNPNSQTRLSLSSNQTNNTVNFIAGGSLVNPDFTWINNDASQESMRLTSNDFLKFNSGYGSVATAYGCRAWVNFNGIGTVSIRASGNVSSITDLGVGVYRANFSNSMPDASFSAIPSCDNTTVISNAVDYATGSVSTRHMVGSGTYYDCTNVSISVFR